MLLKTLTEASGVSGDEDKIRNIILNEIKPYCDDIKVDTMGNIIALKKGKTGKGKKVMLAAHMDEVGFIVTSITDMGFIKFKPVGGIDNKILLSKKVLIGDNNILGIIGVKAIHLQKPVEKELPMTMEDLYIDIGAIDKEDAERQVNIGDFISFDSKYNKFGNNLIKAKALDDRVGCAILIDLMKQSYDFDLYACFTVQEEIGLRGAGVAAYTVMPDMALVIEATICFDIGNTPKHKHATTLGGGPVISVMDSASYSDKDLVKSLVKVAKNNDITIQYKRTTSGSNDAGKIHLTGGGIPTVAVSVPCRYIHSPNSVINIEDYKSCKNLISLFLNEIKEENINKWEVIK